MTKAKSRGPLGVVVGRPTSVKVSDEELAAVQVAPHAFPWRVELYHSPGSPLHLAPSPLHPGGAGSTPAPA